MENSRTKQILVSLVVIVLLGVITGAVVMTGRSDSSGTVASSTVTSTTKTATSGSYKDGTYTADGGYNSPGGFERLSVKVTITNNAVSDATVTTNPSDNEAQEYQQQFQSGFKQYVVGKALNSIKLSRVSGSSLTSQGFNNALDKIKQQAQS